MCFNEKNGDFTGLLTISELYHQPNVRRLTEVSDTFFLHSHLWSLTGTLNILNNFHPLCFNGEKNRGKTGNGNRGLPSSSALWSLASFEALSSLSSSILDSGVSPREMLRLLLTGACRFRCCRCWLLVCTVCWCGLLLELLKRQYKVFRVTVFPYIVSAESILFEFGNCRKSK